MAITIRLVEERHDIPEFPRNPAMIAVHQASGRASAPKSDALRLAVLLTRGWQPLDPKKPTGSSSRCSLTNRARTVRMTRSKTRTWFIPPAVGFDVIWRAARCEPAGTVFVPACSHRTLAKTLISNRVKNNSAGTGQQRILKNGSCVSSEG